MKKETYIYDLETYKNMFLACFFNIKTKEWKVFEISDRINQLDELRIFLNSGIKLIGFNNINFDYPVMHHTILSKGNFSSYDIYDISQQVINERYSSIWDNQTLIPQLDLFKIWHYDNKNKATSLKWLEFAMRWENVQDLPYHHTHVLSLNEMDEVVEYCKNDVKATYQFFLKSLKHIELRQYYTKEEQLNLINASETKIAKDVFGKYLAKDMGIQYKELRKMRTERKIVHVKDLIFPYIEFNHKQNIKLLEDFKNSTWVDTSNMSKKKAKEHTIKFEIDYLNVKRVCGEGGIHSFSKPGIYESNDDYMIYDLDFASYYPHLSFKNKLHPEHIPEKLFSEKYEGFYTERKKYPKSDPRNYVLKIILNSAYGLSKDKYSYLYDPKWQLSIVVNGQLLLAMLTEKVVEATSYNKILFENTDGAAFIIKRSEKELVDKVCQEMFELSGIALEAQECKKLIIRDVNNYINIISDDNIKFKGAFEIDRDFHKNHSKRIVPIALAEYFIKGNNPKNIIKNHLGNDQRICYHPNDSDNELYKNYGIFDFCLGAKMKGQNKLFKREIQGHKVIDSEIGKMNRYYINKDGYELIKKLPPLEKNYLSSTDLADKNQMNIFDVIEDDTLIDPKDRETNIEAGWKCMLFNKYQKKNNYNIDYSYYIKECYKIINTLEN